MHFLDDLWDFPTKSLLLVFNLWEAENLHFRILMFQGSYGTQKLWDFYSVNIFAREASEAQETHEGAHEARTRPGGTDPILVHSTLACFLVERRLTSHFLWLTPSRTKTYAIFF
jgi:hypothetical protein